MKITIATRHLQLRINKQKVLKLANTMYAFSLRYAQRNEIPKYNTTTLVVTSDTGMTTVNRRALNHEGPTDVITLAYAATPGAPSTAEIFVNAQRANEIGDKTRARTWFPDHELALYIAHGFNHLAGHDDATSADAQKMRNRERNWVRRADAAGYINGLILREKASNG